MRKKKEHLLNLIKVDEKNINVETPNKVFQNMTSIEIENLEKNIQYLQSLIEKSGPYHYDLLKNQYSILKSAIDESANGGKEYSGKAIKMIELYEASFKTFETIFPLRIFPLKQYFKNVEQIQSKPTKNKNDLIYFYWQINDDNYLPILKLICNYFSINIHLNQFPKNFINESKELITELLPKTESYIPPKSSPNTPITSGDIKMSIERNDVLKEINLELKDLLGFDLAETINSAKEHYDKNSLLDGELFLRESFLGSIWDELKFTVEKVPEIYKYAIMHDILSITHPNDFTTKDRWLKEISGKSPKDDPDNSPLYNQMRKDEVIKFFANKTLPIKI